MTGDCARYDPNAAYSLSKLLNILFTTELARRLAGTGVVANSVHPGFLRTELAREAAGMYKVFFGVVRPFQKGPEAGADNRCPRSHSPRAGYRDRQVHRQAHTDRDEPACP